jgi:hypothetical protein
LSKKVSGSKVVEPSVCAFFGIRGIVLGEPTESRNEILKLRSTTRLGAIEDT